MRKSILFLALLFSAANVIAQDYDVVIRNAKIMDGTGNSWYYGDIGIEAGKIKKIGRLGNVNAGKTYDASGMVVAPGFIDVHTHIEGDETREPEAKAFIYDGVTSVVTGNCGGSRENIGLYLQYVDSLKLAVNTATLVGHNTVRRQVMGTANRAPTAEEQLHMNQLVAKAMQEGAVGMSTGLIYIPGTYSTTEEIVPMAKVVATFGGVYASHMRNEGDKITEAINEALTIGREANIPVQISHFKLSGQNNWGRNQETLGMIRNARKEGLEVTIDQYPYTASSTGLSTLIPGEILSDGNDSVVARLQRPEVRKYVQRYMVDRLKKRRQKHFTYAQVANYRANTEYNGKNIEEINLLMGRKHRARDEAETVMDMMVNGGASMVFHGMGEEDVKAFMRYPYNMFASDASIRVWQSGVPHPRGYGTNARVLGRYVREQNVISLEEAVRRMTSLPAQKFGLKTKGLLKEGMDADIVVFDAATVMDNATYAEPHQYSTGFKYVLVNGVPVVEEGKHNGARPGKALYGPGYRQ